MTPGPRTGAGAETDPGAVTATDTGTGTEADTGTETDIGTESGTDSLTFSTQLAALKAGGGHHGLPGLAHRNLLSVGLGHELRRGHRSGDD